MGVHNIKTVEDFATIKKENKLVVLDAFATWCGPCKAIAPTVVQWSNEEKMKDVFFAKFDVDEVPALAKELGVRSMPTFIIFKDGERDSEFVGANPQGLVSLINKKVADLGPVAAAPVAPEAAPADAPAAAPGKDMATEETKPATDV